MQNAETVLDVLRDRGRRGLPCNELYRQLFNPQMYLMAYGRLYSNTGAMTPGVDGETADGMSLAKIEHVIGMLRHERYRFRPVKRIYIPKKNGKKRPLGVNVQVVGWTTPGLATAADRGPSCLRSVTGRSACRCWSAVDL